jgi:hypothetical protein
MSIPPNYGDPTIVTSWVKGVIPTVVNPTDVNQANRNKVYIVGRSKINVAVLNAVAPPLTKDQPINVQPMATDQYIYFHLAYEPLAGSISPPGTNVTPGPNFLTMVPRYITQPTLTTVSYPPVAFILNTSGTIVAPGAIQPISLTPVGTGTANKLNYDEVFDLSSVTSSPLYLIPQATDSIAIYKNVTANRVDSPLSSLDEEAPNVPGNNVYAGVWYKTYTSLANATSGTSPNIWHVKNPFKNSGGDLVNTVISPGLNTVQLGAFTGGGTELPVYTAGSGTPANYQQSPTATEVFNSAGGNPITLAQGVEMTGYIGDVGNVLANWGLSDIEITFIPYQASTMYSGATTPALGCYTSAQYSGLAEFQEFATSAYNDILTYIDPYTGNSVYPTGCVDNTTVGYLNSTATSGGVTTNIFNNCMLTDSEQCGGTATDVNGYWYQYCTGNNTCGTNNCFGMCPEVAGKYIPCVRDYNYSTTSTNSTYYSCNPVTPNPPGTISSSLTLILIIVGVLIFLIILGILLYYFFFRKKPEPPPPVKAAPPVTTTTSVTTVPVSPVTTVTSVPVTSVTTVPLQPLPPLLEPLPPLTTLPPLPPLEPLPPLSSSLYSSSLYSGSLYPGSIYPSYAGI